jgi:DNA-binding NarL/FixJ family response regulator
MASDPVRILLVDDHPYVLAGIRAILGAESGFSIIGEACDGLTALRMAIELAPDVVLLDISMPEMSGLELARALRAECPEIRLLAFTVHAEVAYARHLLEQGVSGYLLKTAAAEELVDAVRAVVAGGVYVDSAIADKVIGPFPRAIACARPEPTAPLSGREEDVLRLIAAGHTNGAISSQLNISEYTIQEYKLRAMEKLGLRSRVDIVRYAAEQGWLQRKLN